MVIQDFQAYLRRTEEKETVLIMSIHLSLPSSSSKVFLNVKKA